MLFIASEFLLSHVELTMLASIFKNPETPEIQYTTPSAVTAAYKVGFYYLCLCGFLINFWLIEIYYIS